jgi:hypothetical protein
MAGFEVTLYGRFWVTPEADRHSLGVHQWMKFGLWMMFRCAPKSVFDPQLRFLHIDTVSYLVPCYDHGNFDFQVDGVEAGFCGLCAGR